MRIVRLLMVLLALSAATLSAATHSTGSFGGPKKSGAHTKQMTAAGWYYYCYSDGIYKSCDGYDDCMNACLADCGPPCTYEGEAQ